MIPFTTCGKDFEAGIRLFDQRGQRSIGDDHGVLATDGDRQLIWYSKGATKVLRSISCSNVPIDAIICNFPVAPTSERIRSTAIAILLTSDLLQLHLFNGETFDIHLPFPMAKMYSSSEGLILQRKLSPVEFFNYLDTSSMKMNSHFNMNDSDLNRERSFDVKLWLDETHDEQQMQFEPTHPTMESPAYHEDNHHLLSPQYSVVDSLEKYMHANIGSGPSSCFFSIAHPTAPVRPVRLVLNQASNSTSRIIIGQNETQSQGCEKKMMSNSEATKIQSDFIGQRTDYSSRKRSNKSDTDDCKGAENYSSNWNKNDLDDGRNFLSELSEHSLIASEGNLLCTLQCGTSCIVLWRVGQVADAAEEEGEEEGINYSDYSQSMNNISMATSTTVANSSVLDSRRYNFRDRERDLAASPSSFLNLSASGTSRQVSTSLHSNSLSMNVSNSSGGSGSAASLAGGMITSALMPFESLSGPSISLERDIRRSARVSNSHRGIKSTFTGNATSRYAHSSAALSALSPSFSTSPMSIDQAPPTRQSSRLANQRRTASSQGKPLPSTRSAHTASPLTPFQNHSHSPAFPLSERERERERHNTFTNDLSINTAEVLSASQSHRTTPDQRAQSPGIASRSSHISATRVEEKEHTLCSDTSMTALTVIDLESLSGRWASSSSSGNETGCVGLACDLEENLSVTFSGGEDSLGGLQIHFLHAARGAHAHFQIMFSSQKSQMPYSVFLRKLPSFTPSNDGSIDDDLCSIAHLQISLNNSIGHQNADISDFGLGRFRGSSSSIPISILMHRLKNSHEDDGSKKMEMENIDDPNVKVYVTVLIGGQPIGGRQPLIHTDVLDSASLSGSSSSSLSSSSLHVSHTVALHSLGISGSHILLVDRSTIGSRISSPEQCSVLSGPRYLFKGDGVDGINGVVAQAICSTFSEFKILKRDTKGIRMRRGEKYDNADSSVGSDLMGDKQNGTNYVIEDSSVLVADILALMLLIQSQVGPKYVLRLLLFSAFGLSLGYDHADSSEAHALVESESRLKSRCIFMDEMHSRKEDFFLVCSNSVTSNRGILAESKEGLTIRAVILDIYHSVLQDQLLRGKSAVDRPEGSCVRILCDALCSVVQSVSLAVRSITVYDGSTNLTQDAEMLFISSDNCPGKKIENCMNDGHFGSRVNSREPLDPRGIGAIGLQESSELYIAYYKSILDISGSESVPESDKVPLPFPHDYSPLDIISHLRAFLEEGLVHEGGSEEGSFAFTGNPHFVPHVFDWLTECVRAVASNGCGCGDLQDLSSSQIIEEGDPALPLLYSSDSLHGDPSAQSWCESSLNKVNTDAEKNMRERQHSVDVYPALTFTKKFFELLLSSRRGQADCGRNLNSVQSLSIKIASPNQTSIHFANAFIQISKGDLANLSLLPPPLKVFVELALHQSKEFPFFPMRPEDPPGSPRLAWPSPVLIMIGRNDLCAHLEKSATVSVFSNKSRGIVGESSSQSGSRTEESLSLDGLTEIEEEASRLRFADDDRVHEVCRLLRSSSGMYLRLEKAPEVSDLDHRHKLQMRLLILCRRSLACPVGRGALTLGSLTPLMAEALPCPPLSLAGRIPPNNSPLLLSTGTAPPDLSLWPEFHNGVAAGLRVSSPQENSPSTSSSSSYTPRSTGGASTVSRNWIVYNRTATADDSSFHAGVLLALGLQGHLRVLSVTDICDYLTQGDQLTTIALLVGLPASRLGTADPLLSKTLCLHVPSLLPHQHWDIEILPQVQTAALVGLGLLYCHSGHRLMTEFLLAELGRRPTSDRDRGDCREAVSFAAAWALGVVLLGKGKGKAESPNKNSSTSGLGGLTDLCIEDRLYQHLEGGKRPPDSNLFPYAGVPQGDGHATGGRSSRVLEGDQLNTGVTGPGAAVALGLMYIRSRNEEICHRLSLPLTSFALESVRPDLLLYRALARCLVLWDAVDPTDAWIHSQTPDAVMQSLFPSKVQAESERIRRKETRGKVDLDPRSALAVYLNVVTGHCWGIGLVFAGTANETAKGTLLGKLKMLQLFRDNKQPFPLSFTPNSKTLRPLVESCIGSVALALSCVMAGTGDLSCLRILRFLRWKVDDVTYGTHLSLAMAIGILFLSGGSASLRRDPMSCACLLLATAPRFPMRTVDNQYHLQALRHLYVLAVEARALQIVDADTGSAVSVEIEVELVCGTRLFKRAPCLLPELITVRSVSLPYSTSTSSLYYPASMVITRLESGSYSRIPHPLYVKRRPVPSPPPPSKRAHTSMIHIQDSISIEVRKGAPRRASVSAAKSRRISASLLSSLTGRLCGGRQQCTTSTSKDRVLLSRMQEAGLVEAQSGLDYLLSAASISLTDPHGNSDICSAPPGDVTGSIEAIFRNGTGYATMSDIALDLSRIGPLNDGIFLRAMSGLTVMEK